ncbi:MAG: competence protein ComEC [Candidatus Cloacimonadota bacterium]|jgi:competence protein ComEC|nr:competence protein ComEC [Candidatus Cloacimonadota bacterium]
MEAKSSPPPFVVIAIFWCAGLILAHLLQIPLITLSLLVLFLIFIFLYKKQSLFLLIIILCLAALNYQLQQKLPKGHIQLILDRNRHIKQPITGRIISEYREDHYILELKKIKKFATSGNIFLYTKNDSLNYGDLIRTVASIFPITKNSNPAAFNYRSFLETKQIYGTGIARTTIQILGNQSSFLSRFIINSRVYLQKQITKKFRKNSAFVKAILLGDKKDLGDAKQNFVKAGLSHIFAVSGLHVGIISSVIFIILHLFIKHKPTIRYLLIFILLYYAAICQWRASVTRAVIMLSVYFIARNIQRTTLPNNILALSLVIITIFDPHQMFTPGFQLSFLAVFTLVNFIPKFKFITLQKTDQQSMSYIKKFLNWAALIIISSLLLGITLAPITIFYFHQFSLNGTIANIVAMPLMGIILIPLTMLIIILPVGWSVYQAAFSFFYFILEKWVTLSANFPLYSDFVSLSTLQVLLLYIVLFSIFLLLNKKRLRLLLGIIVLATVSFFLLNREVTQNLRITFFDCGLGDIILVETPSNKNILIDTGSAKTAKKFSNSCLPYLIQKKIKTLDYLVITHAHEDHFGSLPNVFDKLNVKNFVITDEFIKSEVWQDLQTYYINEPKCQQIIIQDTLQFQTDDVKMTILHPDDNYSSDNINNMSIVMRLDYQQLSVLFTGDLEEEGEAYLISKYTDLLDVDFLKAGHHGSKTSSSLEFIQATSPEYAVISTSLHNRFNFPQPETLQSFSFLNDNLFITGKDGAVILNSDGSSVDIKTLLSSIIIHDNTL